MKENFDPIKALPANYVGSLVIYQAGNPRAHRYVRVNNEVFHVGRYEQEWHRVEKREIAGLAAALNWSQAEVRNKIRRARAAHEKEVHKEEFENWVQEAAKFGLEFERIDQVIKTNAYTFVSFRQKVKSGK